MKIRHFGILFLFFSILATLQLQAQKSEYYISGMVRDSVTLEPLPYASVTLTDGRAGTLTDSRGIFGLTAPVTATGLQVTCLGYERKTVPVAKGSTNLYDILMAPATEELREVVVRKKKYSKKNNPAVDFARRLRHSRDANDPRRRPLYSYVYDQHITLALNDFQKRDESSRLFKRFPFLWDYVDTSEISGKPILRLASHDKAAHVSYTHGSRTEKVDTVISSGIDEVADVASMRAFYEDVLREVDLYDNNINILQNRFVSPLSPIAPDFYRFYLTDTVEVNSERCIVLSFYPRNSSAFGFIGQVYVPLDVESMPIRRVTMRTPHDINLNFIESLRIHQDFATAPDGSSLKLSDDITIEGKVAPGTPGIYCRRHAVYKDHAFDSVPVLSAEAAARQDSLPSRSESRTTAELMTRLRQVPLYYWGEKIVSALVKGYVPTGRDSKFDVGPLNTMVSHNSYEGWRFRLGGMTTANLSPHFFARGYAAYGTSDHRFKYSAEVEWAFNRKDYHSREFPIRSVRLTHSYDIDHIGQHYLFTNSDNFFLSLRRLPDPHVAYRRFTELRFTWEWENNFSVMLAASSRRLAPTPDLPFIDGNGRIYHHLNTNGLTVELRYAPGEKFYQTKSYRIPINLDAPVVTLTHTFAPRGALSNSFGSNRTELALQKRFWLSAFGYTDIVVRGGHVWDRTTFTDLLTPNANLSYTIQPESFALMNPMEFITDTYAEMFFTYWANGALLNYIPLVKKLKLREVVGANVFWGSLSNRNSPALHPDLLQLPAGTGTADASHTPYVELSAGLDNIFRCLRVDYVWRITHRHPAYEIDRGGLRIAFHMTF